MTYVMRLSDRFMECPKSWQNFISSLGSEDVYADVPIPIINANLIQFDARYVEADNTYTVYFDSREGAMLFELRWA